MKCKKEQVFKIKDLLECVIDNRGKTPPIEQVGYNLIEINSIATKNRYPDYSVIKKHVNEFTYKSSFRAGHPKRGDILIPTVGTLDAICLMDRNDCCIAQNLIALRANEKVCNNEYLYYMLCNPIIRKRVLNLDIGGVQPSIKVPHLLNLEIDIPDVIIQKKVANILSIIDDKIELNNKINKNLYELIYTYFESLIIKNPDKNDWDTGIFNDLISNILGGDWGKESPNTNYINAVYCIRGADIPEIQVGNKGKMPTRYILTKNLTNKKLGINDIVIEISGGSPTQSTGRAAFICESLLKRFNHDMVCTNFCRAIKPKKGYELFFYIYWSYLYKKNIFFSYENGTTGIKNLDINGIINNENIIIPPLHVITSFSKLCMSLLDQIYNNALENESLRILRDSLLPKLMSGEIDISKINI